MPKTRQEKQVEVEKLKKNFDQAKALVFINFDKLKGELEFSGNSLPKDANKFYEPIIDWIDNYLASPRDETVIRFMMSYYNTPSYKIFFQVLKKFEQFHNDGGSKVRVVWGYPSDDPDLRGAGIDYADIMKLPFEFVEFEEM